MPVSEPADFHKTRVEIEIYIGFSYLLKRDRFGAMRTLTVSTSVFLACHQCYCAGLSFAWGLNLLAFSEARRQGFSPGTPVFSSFLRLMVKPINKKKFK